MSGGSGSIRLHVTRLSGSSLVAHFSSVTRMHDSKFVSCLGILHIKIYLCAEPLSPGLVRSDVILDSLNVVKPLCL